MFRDALQDIDEVGVRVDTVQSTGGEQALNHADALSANFSPIEQPGLTFMKTFS